MKQLRFDPADYSSLLNLMKHHKDFPNMLFGENTKGETTTLSISETNIVYETMQHNNVVKRNTYWQDGTVEEAFVRN